METRKMSDWRRASFQSGKEMGWRIQRLSGLGPCRPAWRISCWSRNVMGRLAPSVWAWAWVVGADTRLYTTPKPTTAYAGHERDLGIGYLEGLEVLKEIGRPRNGLRTRACSWGSI